MRGRSTNRIDGAARATEGDDRTVAVLLHNALDLARKDIEGLIPRNADPLVHASKRLVATTGLPVLALHGILQAIGAENVFALGSSTNAAALLRIVRRVRMSVVGLLANNGAVNHQSVVDALAAAVEPACGRNPFALAAQRDVFSNRLVAFDRFHRVGATGQGKSRGTCSSRSQEAPSA